MAIPRSGKRVRYRLYEIIGMSYFDDGLCQTKAHADACVQIAKKRGEHKTIRKEWLDDAGVWQGSVPFGLMTDLHLRPLTPEQAARVKANNGRLMKWETK